MGRKTYNETPTRKRKANVKAMIYASVFPAPDQRNAIAKSEKERRKRKEKEAKPIHQFPGCRDDNPAPNPSASGTIQSRSFFLRFIGVILHYLQSAVVVLMVEDIILLIRQFCINHSWVHIFAGCNFLNNCDP